MGPTPAHLWGCSLCFPSVDPARLGHRFASAGAIGTCLQPGTSRPRERAHRTDIKLDAKLRPTRWC